MADEDADVADGPETDPDSTGVDSEVDALREDLDALSAHLEERTVHRDEIEGDLRYYIRKRLRRGHARGWGPYLVLLYGTAMTLGAFYFLSGGWAILAMLVIWLSTLGLYTLMVLVGLGVSVLGLPSRGLDLLSRLRR